MVSTQKKLISNMHNQQYIYFALTYSNNEWLQPCYGQCVFCSTFKVAHAKTTWKFTSANNLIDVYDFHLSIFYLGYSIIIHISHMNIHIASIYWFLNKSKFCRGHLHYYAYIEQINTRKSTVFWAWEIKYIKMLTSMLTRITK